MPDPLASLSDTFSGAALDAKWTVFEGDGTASIAVSGGELNLTCNAGASADSFWFNGEQGILIHQSVTGNFDVIATLRIRNTADSGLPPATQFRIAGIAAHDPDRATDLDYVHVGLGATAEADLRCEWKTTVASVSTFGSVSAPTGVGQIRLTRSGQLFTAYYRASAGDAWTTVQAMDRTAAALPNTLQVGMMVYSNQFAHDIRGFYDSIVFSTPGYVAARARLGPAVMND